MISMKLIVLLAGFCAAQADDLEERNPKLFFVSTSSSTSTVVTTRTCYQTKAALTTCGKRKKRNLLDDVAKPLEPLTPSR